MNRRGAGIILLAISALLYISRNTIHYLVAAMLAASDGRYHSGTLENALEVTKSFSVVPEVIALILGVSFLVWSEIKKE